MWSLRRKKAGWGSWLLGGLTLLAFGLGCWYFFLSKQKQLQPYVAYVDATQVVNAQWQTEINATGTISAIKGVMLKAEVPGQVTKISFKSGQFVKEGQSMVQIYPDVLTAQLKKAQSALTLAKMEFQRGQKLIGRNIISQQDFDRLKAQYEESQSSVDELQAQLRQHNITAPFSGRAGLRRISLGDRLSPGDSLVSLQQLDPIRVDFSVPEIYINELKEGELVEVRPASLPDKVFLGKIYAVDSMVDPDTRSIDVRASIPNQEEVLIPGTFAKVRLLAGKNRSVATIPQTALTYDLAGAFVYQVQQNIVKKERVNIGERRGNDVEILSGLRPRDWVVTAGQVKLFDGARVQIETPKTMVTSTENPVSTEKKAT